MQAAALNRLGSAPTRGAWRGQVRRGGPGFGRGVARVGKGLGPGFTAVVLLRSVIGCRHCLVASAAFGFVEGGIGAVDQLFGGFAVLPCGKAGRRGERTWRGDAETLDDRQGVL